jgi:hypothetical protein
VVIEARDFEGLVGHAIVLVQALPPTHLPSGIVPTSPSLNGLLPKSPSTSSTDNLALIPAELLGAVNLHRPSNGAALSTQIPHIQPINMPHPPHILGIGTTMETPIGAVSTVHPTVSTRGVKLFRFKIKEFRLQYSKFSDRARL